MNARKTGEDELGAGSHQNTGAPGAEGGRKQGGREGEEGGGMIKSEAQRQNKFQKANVAACCSKDDSGLRLADITRLWRGD